MPGQPSYFIARIAAPESRENFVLVPEGILPDQRVENARRRWRAGQRWIRENQAETGRLALVLRGMGHRLAALLQEQYPDFQTVSIELIQEILLDGELRLQLSVAIAPAVIGSLWPSPVPENADTGDDPAGLKAAWRNALVGKGRLETFLPAMVTLHHRMAASALAQRLGMDNFVLPQLGESTITETAVSLSYFAEGPKYLYVMNNLPYHAVREVLAFGKFTKSEDSPWPTAALKKGSTSGHAQLFPVEMEMDPYRESSEQAGLAAMMWQQVSELNDLDADILDMMSAIWVEQARGPNDFAHVNIRQLLKMRGLRPKQGEGGRDSGFRPDQKQQLFRSLAHISNLYLLLKDVELPSVEGGRDGKRDRREVRSRAFIITDIAGNRTANGGQLIIDEFLIRPGVLFGHYLFGNRRQVALLAAQAIRYDRIREDWEKRLARYFSWQWRNDAMNQRGTRAFLVKTLLENSGKSVDNEHQKRTRQRLEKALDRLKKDGVIADWSWDRQGSKFLDSTRWHEHWLGWSIEVVMPEFIKQHYQHMLPTSAYPAIAAEKKYFPAPTAVSTPAIKVAPENKDEALTPLGMLIAYRKRENISQEEMAQRLSISQSYYSLLERGSRKANAAIERSILQLLSEAAAENSLS